MRKGDRKRSNDKRVSFSPLPSIPSLSPSPSVLLSLARCPFCVRSALTQRRFRLEAKSGGARGGYGQLPTATPAWNRPLFRIQVSGFCNPNLHYKKIEPLDRCAAAEMEDGHICGAGAVEWCHFCAVCQSQGTQCSVSVIAQGEVIAFILPVGSFPFPFSLSLSLSLSVSALSI